MNVPLLLGGGGVGERGSGIFLTVRRRKEGKMVEQVDLELEKHQVEDV